MKAVTTFSVLSLVAVGCQSASHDPLPKKNGSASFVREETKQPRAFKDKLEGVTAPALHVFDWTNTDVWELNVSDLHGKVVLLYFWGVWSDESKKAIPNLMKLHDRYKKDGLVLVGIHSTRQGGKMADFAKDKAITWPLAIDKLGESAKAYHVDDFPDYYLIDRKGTLRVADLADHALEQAIEALLTE